MFWALDFLKDLKKRSEKRSEKIKIPVVQKYQVGQHRYEQAHTAVIRVCNEHDKIGNSSSAALRRPENIPYVE